MSEKAGVLRRIAPSLGQRSPLLDLVAKRRIVGIDVKRVEAVDDFPHQFAHLCVVDARDIGSGVSPTIGVENKDVRVAASYARKLVMA